MNCCALLNNPKCGKKLCIYIFDLMCVGNAVEAIVWNSTTTFLETRCRTVTLDESLGTLLLPIVILILKVFYGDVPFTSRR